MIKKFNLYTLLIIVLTLGSVLGLSTNYVYASEYPKVEYSWIKKVVSNTYYNQNKYYISKEVLGDFSNITIGEMIKIANSKLKAPPISVLKGEFSYEVKEGITVTLPYEVYVDKIYGVIDFYETHFIVYNKKFYEEKNSEFTTYEDLSNEERKKYVIIDKELNSENDLYYLLLEDNGLKKMLEKRKKIYSKKLIDAVSIYKFPIVLKYKDENGEERIKKINGIYVFPSNKLIVPKNINEPDGEIKTIGLPGIVGNFVMIETFDDYKNKEVDYYNWLGIDTFNFGDGGFTEPKTLEILRKTRESLDVFNNNLIEILKEYGDSGLGYQSFYFKLGVKEDGEITGIVDTYMGIGVISDILKYVSDQNSD